MLVAANVDRPLTGDHIAFHVSPDQLRKLAAKLKSLGRDYQLARADTALYFQDFDHHVFEITGVGIEAELQGNAPPA